MGGEQPVAVLEELIATKAATLAYRGAATLTALLATTDFQWLAPTTANLAQLTAPVPAGFTEISG